VVVVVGGEGRRGEILNLSLKDEDATRDFHVTKHAILAFQLVSWSGNAGGWQAPAWA
jgi:hypothetical protein